MRMNGFWGHFEEDASPSKYEKSNHSQPQTRQGEETNQHEVTFMSAHTQTATREEPDQDTGNSFYQSILIFNRHKAQRKKRQ